MERQFLYFLKEHSKGDTDLAEFKDGTQIIAVKNRLPMLPVYIKTNANEILHTAINKREKGLRIEIEFGDVIDYKDRSMSLEMAYRKRFNKGEQSPFALEQLIQN